MRRMRWVCRGIFAKRAKFLALCTLASLTATSARGQDSFVRLDDAVSGQPVISVLGTGLGLTYAAMALELECPAGGVWTMDVTGIRVAPGTRIDIGFGDARGAFIPVAAVPLDFADDRLRFTVALNAFATALARAQAEHPASRGSDLRVLLGGIVGLSIGRDAMAREMAAFLGDCEPRRRTATAQR